MEGTSTATAAVGVFLCTRPIWTAIWPKFSVSLPPADGGEETLARSFLDVQRKKKVPPPLILGREGKGRASAAAVGVFLCTRPMLKLSTKIFCLPSSAVGEI